MFGSERCSEDVDLTHTADVVRIEVDHQRGNLDACVVDEDVEAAESLRGGGDCLFPVGVVGDVQLYEAGFDSARTNSLCGGTTLVFENVADHH